MAIQATRTAHLSPVDDGAVLERLIRLRTACHGLAGELAASRRRLRAVEAELARVKQQRGMR